jgi:hypothetical protein
VSMLIGSYVLASSLAPRGAALLAPMALLPWFFYLFWQSSWFATTEVWAAGFGLAAVMCLMKRRPVPSLVFLTAAVAAREFMILIIPAWILVWWITGHQKSRLWFPALAVVAPTVVLAAHLLVAPRTIGGAASMGAWLHGGFPRLLSALRFGYTSMPGGMWVSLAIGVAAMLGAALTVPRWRMAALLVVTTLPTLFLLVFSGGEHHYYWGAFYTPIAASIAPAVFARLFPAQEVAG